MNNELNSIEDIDAMLDAEYGISNEEPVLEDTNTEDVANEEVSQETETEQPIEDDTLDNEEVKSDEKPSDEDKKDYAFAKIRKENSELKNELESARYSDDILKKIATQYGYNNVKEFADAYEKANDEKIAKEKGYDPVLYSQLQEANRRIEQLENANKEQDLVSKANNFRASVENAIEKYNLGESGRKEIFDKLEEAGYTVDALLSSPNPDILIKGVLSDRIAELSKQSQIEKMEKLNGVSEGSHEGGSKEKTISLDDIIAAEMKQYKADNYL